MCARGFCCLGSPQPLAQVALGVLRAHLRKIVRDGRAGLADSVAAIAALLGEQALALRDERRTVLRRTPRSPPARSPRPADAALTSRAHPLMRPSVPWPGSRGSDAPTARARSRGSGIAPPQSSHTPKLPVSSRACAAWISSSSWRSRPSRRCQQVRHGAPRRVLDERARLVVGQRGELAVRHRHRAKHLPARLAQQPTKLAAPVRVQMSLPAVIESLLSDA